MNPPKVTILTGLRTDSLRGIRLPMGAAPCEGWLGAGGMSREEESVFGDFHQEGFEEVECP